MRRCRVARKDPLSLWSAPRKHRQGCTAHLSPAGRPGHAGKKGHRKQKEPSAGRAAWGGSGAKAARVVGPVLGAAGRTRSQGLCVPREEQVEEMA